LDKKKSVSYKDAGVDIDAGNRFVEIIKPLVKSTFRPGVQTDIGGFGGLFGLDLNKYPRPTLVSSTDGVGTKLKLAFMADKHDTVGVDLVAMCVNDIIVQGAEPLFFLDYFATGRLAPEKAAEVVKGIAQGCVDAGCALIGGETAEMPGMYADGEYDLAGFTVGVVNSDEIIDGSAITIGDRVIGLASSGLHSNGYSLARKVFFENMGLNLDSQLDELSEPLGVELLTPTRIYVKSVINLMRSFRIKGIAHITGGGLLENLPRVLPEGCKVVIDSDSWEKPPIFEAMRQGGNVAQEEMYRTFNYGIGLVLVVPEKEVDDIMSRLDGLGEKAFLIGEVIERDNKDPQVVLS